LKTLNLFELFEERGDYTQLLKEDGVHFSPQGYDFIAERLLFELPSTPVVMPLHRDENFVRLLLEKAKEK